MPGIEVTEHDREEAIRIAEFTEMAFGITLSKKDKEVAIGLFLKRRMMEINSGGARMMWSNKEYRDQCKAISDLYWSYIASW